MKLELWELFAQVWKLMRATEDEVKTMQTTDFQDATRILHTFGRLFVEVFPKTKSNYMHIIVCHLVDVSNYFFIICFDYFINYFSYGNDTEAY